MIKYINTISEMPKNIRKFGVKSFNRENFSERMLISLLKSSFPGVPDDLKIISYEYNFGGTMDVIAYSSYFSPVADLQCIESYNEYFDKKKEGQMLKITEEQIDSIRDQMAEKSPTAVGYRLMVKPVTVKKQMDGVDAKRFETLAAAGFTDKTENEASKLNHGSDVGVVVSTGDDCYSSGILEKTSNWCTEGDVVIFPRYSGHRAEVPPGSGEIYHFMNDDDIVGKYEGIKI